MRIKDLNENKRLVELDSFKIIGVAENDDYDFITAMAAQICETPISLISLVTEDKQWFLSHHGLQTRETPKEFSFCAHAIQTPDKPFIIQDAFKDERFADNPLTTGEPHVVFYAGIPLVSSKGFPLGSLCVIDNHPKQLTEQQVKLLQKLAKQTTVLLELRRKQFELAESNSALERANDVLELIQASNKIGIWELDINRGKTIWNDLVYEIHEVPVGFDHNLYNGIEFYHPDYQDIISNAVGNAIEKDTPFDVICLLITAKGNQKWVRSTGKRVGEKVIGSFQDITELKQRELKFEGIFNSTMSFIGFLNTDGILLEANNTALEVGGIARKDVVGKYFWDCHWWQISKETQEELKNKFKKAVSGKELTYEVEVNIANGNTTTILFSLRPIFNDQGDVEYVIPEGRPIDDLVHTRDRFKHVLEGTDAGTWEWNVQTGETVLNERWAEIAGYTLRELEPICIDTWMKLTHPDDLEESGRRLQLCFDRKSEYYEIETRMKHKEGHWVWVLARGKVIEWTSDGKPLMMFGTHQDISIRKEAERRLNEAINSLQAVLDASTQVAIIATDRNGIIKLFNSGAEAMLGYTADELVGKETPQIIHLADEVEQESRELTELYKQEINGFNTFVYEPGIGKSVTKEWTYKRKDGSTFPILLSVSPVKSGDEITGYLGVATDITALKKVESEIKALLDLTQEQNERLKNFAHIVTHNLRNHSTGMSGLFGIIESDFKEIAEHEIIALLIRSAENLSQTIEDLTEVVKADLGRNNKLDIQLYEVIEKNIESLTHQINNSGITVSNKVDKDLLIKGVPAYVDSIVLNFISNAIKYRSEERDSFLNIYTIKKDTHIILCFEDNGLGIDLEKYGDKLFGMYKTFHTHEDSRGVGLFITKNQIESIGGKIEVSSEVNKGTIFKIYLPA